MTINTNDRAVMKCETMPAPASKLSLAQKVLFFAGLLLPVVVLALG
jgi:hypothetical protein